MVLDMVKVKAVDGYKVGSVVAQNGKIRGVVTIPADGFDRLVGYCLSDGTWAWVKKDFRK